MKRYFTLRTKVAGLPCTKVYDRKGNGKPYRVCYHHDTAVQLATALNGANASTDPLELACYHHVIAELSWKNEADEAA